LPTFFEFSVNNVIYMSPVAVDIFFDLVYKMFFEIDFEICVYFYVF